MCNVCVCVCVHVYVSILGAVRIDGNSYMQYLRGYTETDSCILYSMYVCTCIPIMYLLVYICIVYICTCIPIITY